MGHMQTMIAKLDYVGVDLECALRFFLWLFSIPLLSSPIVKSWSEICNMEYMVPPLVLLFAEHP